MQVQERGAGAPRRRRRWGTAWSGMPLRSGRHPVRPTRPITRPSDTSLIASCSDVHHSHIPGNPSIWGRRRAAEQGQRARPGRSESKPGCPPKGGDAGGSAAAGISLPWRYPAVSRHRRRGVLETTVGGACCWPPNSLNSNCRMVEFEPCGYTTSGAAQGAARGQPGRGLAAAAAATATARCACARRREYL